MFWNNMLGTLTPGLRSAPLIQLVLLQLFLLQAALLAAAFGLKPIRATNKVRNSISATRHQYYAS